MNQSSPAMAFGQSGAFPRNELQADETVIFEGKPSLVAMCFLGIIWLVLCIGGAVLFLAIWIYLFVCSVVALIAGIIPFLYFYLQWSGTSFAMTNKRVMVHKTDASLQKLSQSLPLSHVTHTVRSQSFTDSMVGAGNIGFSAAAGMPGFMWPSVPGHDTVRPFIDEQLNRMRGPMQQPQVMAPPQYPGYPMQPPMMAAPPGAMPAQMPARRCPSCGMNFGGDGAFCPYCGAKA